MDWEIHNHPLGIFLVANVAYLYDPAPDTSAFNMEYHAVPKEDNAFYDLQSIKIKGGDQYGQLSKDDLALANGTSWDQTRAQKIINDNPSAIQSFLHASKKSLYQDPLIGDPNLVNAETKISPVGGLTSGARVAVIDAEVLAREGHSEEAISLDMSVIKTGETMQQGQNFLIPWLVGTSIKQIGVHWLQNEIRTGTLSQAQLTDIISFLGPASNNTEGLKSSLKMEGLGAVNELTRESRPNLIQSFGIPGWLSLAYLPYSFQPNRTAKYHLSSLSEQLDDVNRACNTLSTPPNLHDSQLKITSQYLTPNGVGKYLNGLTSTNYSSAIYRKCDDLFSVEAAQVTAALYTCQQKQGAFPLDLKQLVPTYLSEVPLDPYNLQPLRYNSVTGTISSVGVTNNTVPSSEKVKLSVNVR